MSENNNWKNYIWVIPLIGVIFLFIGILSPTASANILIISEMFWIWGLDYTSGYGISQAIFFISAYEAFIPSMICFTFLIILFISLSVYVAKTKSNPTSSKNSLIAIGVLIIVIMIIYMVSMEIGFNIYFKRIYSAYGYYPYVPSISFWSFYKVNFGVIGPILGGVFAIIGGIVSKNSDKIDKSIKKKEPSIQLSEGKIDKYSIPEPPYKYCTNCGAELKGIYCSECGTKA